MNNKIIVNYNIRLFAFALPLILSLLISSRVLASDPTALEAAQVIHDDCLERYGLDYSIAQNGYLQAGTYWANHPNFSLFTWQVTNNPAFVRYVISNDFYNLPTEGQIRFNSYSLLELGPNGQCNWYEANTNTTYTCVLVGTLTDLLVPDPDFDNASYVAILPYPDIWHSFISNRHYSQLCVPVEQYFYLPTGVDTDLIYIEYKYRFYKPKGVFLNFNGPYYDIQPYDFYKSDWNYLYSMEDLKKISDLPLNQNNDMFKLDLSTPLLSNWTTFYSNNNVSYESNNEISSTSVQNAISNYESGNKSAITMGNCLEIYCRYFVVNDNQEVFYGNWLHWYSTFPQTFDYTSDNLIDGNQIPSGSDIQINEQQQAGGSSNNNPPSTSENPVTVVVNNNQVPNNQEYPTAVSYNHDNILLQFIQTSKQLPQTFEGYSSFLTAAFAFIPSQIWSIISFGFMASIVIMIVKIL